MVFRKFSLCAVCVMLSASLAYAAPDAPKKELPRSGTLSGTSVSGTGGKSVDAPWGSEDVINGGAPISGSVSKVSERQWNMRIFNNSEDTYSVDLEVAQLNERNTKVKSDHYSYTLRPKQTAERSISAYSNTKQCTLNLLSWKNLTEHKKDAEPTKTAATASAPAAKNPPPNDSEEESEGEEEGE